MGKLQHFSVTLDSPAAVYCEGQVISGHVTVELAEAMEMRGVTLKVAGQAHVYFTEREEGIRTNSSERRMISFTADEEYFKQYFRMFGSRDTSKTSVLRAGRHTFPFSYTLPVGLPATFEGDHGYIRYHCKAAIDRPWKFDTTCKVAFTVFPQVDLNVQPSVMTPVTEGAEKMLCCWCCQSGPVSASMSVCRTGYVPGEFIYVNADVENLANRAMNETRVSLNQVVTYTTPQRARTEITEVSSVSRGKLESGACSSWEAVPIPIPQIPPSSTRKGIIDIQYTLDFDVVPTGPSYNLNISVPVTVGTVPLVTALGYFQSPPPPPYSETPSALPPLHEYPDQPPPPYVEAVASGATPRSLPCDRADFGDAAGQMQNLPPSYDAAAKQSAGESRS